MNLTADIINRTLDRESWARERLAAHAGRTVRFIVGPAHASFAIDPGGRLRDADGAPDLTLSVSPLRLPALLAQPSRWQELVATEGDAALAATLSELALTFPLFVEQAFAKALGPIIGQQLASTGRQLLTMPEYAAQRFTNSVARYVGEETDAGVRTSEAHAFAADVRVLADAVDALSARVDALASAPSGNVPPKR
jgi:ubiquinone biosynthesis accessory factor UbiJ